MVGSSRPSFPAPSEPSLRRLGVGGSGGGGGGGGDRPIRAQVVVALVALLVVLAVPLYLLRRPSGEENAAPAVSASSSAAPLFSAAVPEPDSGKPERVSLGAVQREKCSASRTARGQKGDLCDKLPFFEEALAKAIRENVDCAPKTGKAGTLNYVLTIDFSSQRLDVFPGASGQWKGPQARRAAKCVERSLPAPQWNAITHQYRYYMVAILASYPSPDALLGGAVPDFGKPE